MSINEMCYKRNPYEGIELQEKDLKRRFDDIERELRELKKDVIEPKLIKDPDYFYILQAGFERNLYMLVEKKGVYKFKGMFTDGYWSSYSSFEKALKKELLPFYADNKIYGFEDLKDAIWAANKLEAERKRYEI